MPTILSIETSCDETAISIIKARGTKNVPRFDILSNIVASQIEVHKKWGGVYPALAKREHQRNLVPVLKKALRKARMLNAEYRMENILHSKFNILHSILMREPELLKQTSDFLEKYKKPKVDAIAVTQGPGLEPCLWVGVNFARALAYFWDLPLIPVNHTEAHILVNWATPENSKFHIPDSRFLFPAVCLVVSGGHTELILMRNFGKYEILGQTRDDAAGECFDKAAKILGLGYPGGPIIARLAAQRESKTLNLKLPRPMINSKDYDFSFSGLKTAVLYNFKSQPKKIRESKSYIRAMAAEIQQAVIDVLIRKTLNAARAHNSKTIILGGGVSANNELKKQFLSKVQDLQFKVNFLAPARKFSTDNAVMIGTAAYISQKKADWKDLQPDANLKIK